MSCKDVLTEETGGEHEETNFSVNWCSNCLHHVTY